MLSSMVWVLVGVLLVLVALVFSLIHAWWNYRI
jgi:hypothetical protein